MKKFNSIDDVYNYLNLIPKFKDAGNEAINLGLSAIEAFCERIGSPHQTFKSIHIAGTNGKGTTSYLLSEVYRVHGYKVGMYSSPHLLSYNERVQVDGQEIDNESLMLFFNKYHQAIENANLSYFEISTALAFWYFSQSNVDLAIIETGLGGRLDATNIIFPIVSAITSISLDHTDVLGDTLEKIAYEKGGIIKSDVPVVVGMLPDKARDVIENIAEEKSSDVIYIDELNPSYSSTFSITYMGKHIDLGKSLIEPVNKFNYALSWAILKKATDFPVEDDLVIKALKNIPPFKGRFEQMNSLDWYFSGAHNVEALDAAIEGVKVFGKKPIVVLSIMRDKLDLEVIERFKQFDELYYYELNGPRAAAFDDVAIFLSHLKLFTENEALNKLNELREELVIFVGSFYFYETVKRWTGQFVT